MKVELMSFQMEMLRRDDEKLLIACCGVSSGKTYAASTYIAMNLARGKRIIAGAQNFVALNRVLFGEIKKRLTEWHIPFEHNKSDKEIRVGNGVCYGATSKNPEAILGLSEVDILVIDEAGYCCQELYEWGSDRLRGGSVVLPRKRLFTSPDSFDAAHAWFIDLCSRNQGSIINASALDNIYTSEDFKRDLIERYPPGTQLYEQQVLGKIVSSRSANAAIDDRLFMETRPAHLSGSPVWLGVDVAGQGRDDSMIVAIDEYGVLETRRYHHAETQVLVSEMLELNRKYNVAGGGIDCTGGFGSGVYDYTKSSIKNLDAVNFGSASSSQYYNNLRTEMHFMARDLVKSSEFYVPVTDDGARIREECRYALYYLNPASKTAMFPKEDIRKALGRSPDALDALILAIRSRKLSEGSAGLSNDTRAIAARMLRAHGS